MSAATPRLAALDPAALTEEQRRAVERIGRSRGGAASGPFSVWIRNPALASAAGELGDQLRLHGHLEPRLLELAILVAARHWRSPYPWTAHVRAAAEAGVSPEVIEAVRLGTPPPFGDDDERAVHDVIRELLETGTLTDSSYERHRRRFGLESLIELVTVCGFYSTAALIANAFAVAVPGEAHPFG